ncbi:MAG TPA: hypothetical protein EYG89_03435 [Bacteroidia bacterium]|nr:hypothetical protein [Bacteroidia bacterium]
MGIIIIDGVSASGKSILLEDVQTKLLKERLKFTKLILSEHLTERYFEDKKPTEKMVSLHIENILELVKNIQNIQDNSQFKDNKKVVSILIERLFLTFMSRGLLNDKFFIEKGSFLEDLNIHQVLLIIPKEDFEYRLESTLERRNKYWLEFINSLGGLTGAISHFSKQQEKMIKASETLNKYMKVTHITVSNTHKTSIDKIII